MSVPTLESVLEIMTLKKHKSLLLYFLSACYRWMNGHKTDIKSFCFDSFNCVKCFKQNCQIEMCIYLFLCYAARLAAVAVCYESRGVRSFMSLLVFFFFVFF